MRGRSRPLLGLLLAAALAAPVGYGHPTGPHTGFASTVSGIEPQIPGLLVEVRGGHEQLAVRNWTQKTIVVLDGVGRPKVRLDPGESRAWPEPRIGSTDDPPDREMLVRRWRIPFTADGEPFAIVGFLGYRPPESTTTESGTPTWTIAAAVAGALVLAAAVLALPILRREGEDERPPSTTEP